MNNHIEELKAELKEMTDKKDKLSKYIRETKIKGKAFELICRQLAILKIYIEILEDRILLEG